jgi:hypothetical protein
VDGGVRVIPGSPWNQPASSPSDAESKEMQPLALGFTKSSEEGKEIDIIEGKEGKTKETKESEELRKTEKGEDDCAGESKTAGARTGRTEKGKEEEEDEEEEDTFEPILSPVLALVWRREEQLLYTGGDRGQISAFDLAPAMEELGRKDPSFGIKASPRGRMASEEEVNRLLRGIKTSGAGGFGSRPYGSRGSSPNGSPRGYASVPIKDEYSPILRESLARLLWSVRGHGDSIASLEIVGGPQALLSASYDHTVRLWGTDGDARGVRLGSLLQGIRGKMRHPKWNFHVAVTDLEDSEMGDIQILMRALASRRETLATGPGSQEVSPRAMSIRSGGNRSQFGSPRSSKLGGDANGSDANGGSDSGSGEEEDDNNSDRGRKVDDGTMGIGEQGQIDSSFEMGRDRGGAVSPPWEKADINHGSRSVADASLGGLNDNGPGVSPMNNNGSAGNSRRRSSSGIRRSSSMSIQPEVPDHPDDFDQASYEQFQLDWFKDHPRRGKSNKKKNGGKGSGSGKESPSFSMSKGVRNPHRIIGRGSKRAAVSFDRAMEAAGEKSESNKYASKRSEDSGNYMYEDDATEMEEPRAVTQLRMERLRQRLAKYGFDAEGNEL